MTDRERLLQTVASVYAFYERELTELALKFWVQDLDGYPIDPIERAFVAHRRDPERGHYCPKPADIIRQIKGDAEEAALITWGQVIEAARRGGGSRFEGPTQQALDAIGGMGALRMSSESQNPFLQRQFVAAFKAFRAREDTSPLLAQDVIRRASRLHDATAGGPSRRLAGTAMNSRDGLGRGGGQ